MSVNKLTMLYTTGPWMVEYIDRESPEKTLIGAFAVLMWHKGLFTHQGPVVQSSVSLTSSLVVKMLTVLVSTISNSQVFFDENM